MHLPAQVFDDTKWDWNAILHKSLQSQANANFMRKCATIKNINNDLRIQRFDFQSIENQNSQSDWSLECT